MLDDYEVSAEVAGAVKTKYGVAYRVKACIPEHGFWINGMMVYPPNVDHPEWSVNPPGIPNRKGKFVVEFNKSFQLWLEVEEKCLEVAQEEHSLIEYESKAVSPTSPIKKDVVIEDIPDGPITLEDIPF
jgi:hypothetical protein